MKTNVPLGSASLPSPAGHPGSNTNSALALEIRGIKDPVPVSNPWMWVWIGSAVLVAALAGWMLYKKWRKQLLAPKPVKLVPAHVVAREKLRDALRFISDPYVFCALVSDAIREYLEQRFQFHAPDRTTEEFLAELRDSSILNLEQKQWLGDFLNTCDMVKFARAEPHQSELEALHAAANRLVNETEPRPEMPALPATVPEQAQPAS